MLAEKWTSPEFPHLLLFNISISMPAPGYLLLGPGSPVESDLTKHEEQVAIKKEGFKRLPLTALVAVLLCTVANIFLVYNQGLAQVFTRKAAKRQNAPLRRPNQFIGLDQIAYNASYPGLRDLELTTFPAILQQVDKSRPRSVLPSSSHLYFTSFGSISSENRLFLAMNQISTIVQFRARDYGMERCALQLTLQSEYERKPGVELDHTKLDFPPEERSWRLSGDTRDLEIWFLDTTEWLNPSKLSFSSRPKRARRLDGLVVGKNQTITTYPFNCPSDSIQTFELFCISPGCKIDIWQDRELPAMGMLFSPCLEADDSSYEGLVLLQRSSL